MAMPGRGKPIAGRAAIAVAVVVVAVVVVVAAIGGFAVQAAGPHAAGPPVDNALSSACASPSTATLGVDAFTARRIYEGELYGLELREDAARVQHSRALLESLAGANRAGVYAAVHALVYMPGWHIVRLRVIERGKVLADVGGPFVIAPVTGALRAGGRTLASYVMSVQDDAGYVKLVTRFIGVPVDLYRNGSFVMGTLTPAPALPPSGSSVSVHGRTYQVDRLSTHAFPSGPLAVALFLRTPPGNSSISCSAVEVAAWGSIARHLAGRFSVLPPHYKDLVTLLRATTGGLGFVRSGARQLAGGAAPASLPKSGTVHFRGRSWSVYSWEPVPPARVYFLIPSR